MSGSDPDSGAGGGSEASSWSRADIPGWRLQADTLEALLDDAPQAIAITDGPAHVVRWVNPAFRRLAGVTAEDLLERPWKDVLPAPAAGAAALRLLERAFSSGRAEQDQLVTEAGSTPDHPVVWSYAVWPLRERSGAIRGLVVEVRDWTGETALARRLSDTVAEVREVNQRLLASVVREHEGVEALEAARQALRRSNEELERRVAARTADLADTNRALAAEMAARERTVQERNSLLRQLVTAVEDEGRRISRELHDQLGQHVTGLMLGLHAVRQATESPELAQWIGKLEKLTASIAQDIQNLAIELRPPSLDSLGLTAALQDHLLDWGARTGIACDFFATGMDGDRLAPEIETTIYRVVQEGLTNVVKHAGATRVSLVLELRNGMVSAILEDDGEGFDVEGMLAAPEKAKRLGLRGMRERVALLSGELEIESAPGTGTSLFLRIPCPATRPD